MASLKIIGSSSSGNAYILDCGSEQLILELGVSWKEILKALNFDLSKVRACLVTHSHQDHSKYIPTAIKSGLTVFSNKDVQLVHPKVKVLELGKKKRIGGFSVQPIPLFHDVMNYGFLIEHKDTGKILFATDTSQVPYKFKGVRHFVIEANNDIDEIIDNACDNEFSRSASQNHLELNDTIETLKQNYSVKTQTIVLIHLSNTNINAVKAKKKVQEELGFGNVYIAEKGLEIELNKEEF